MLVSTMLACKCLCALPTYECFLQALSARAFLSILWCRKWALEMCPTLVIVSDTGRDPNTAHLLSRASAPLPGHW